MSARPGADLARIREAFSSSSASERLERIVSLARTACAADGSGITLIRSGKAQTLAASGPLVQAVDRLQYDSHQGPGLDAVSGIGLVHVDDLSAEQRWEGFAGLCVAKTGVRSIVSLHLEIGDDVSGALNLYALQARAFNKGMHEQLTLIAPFVQAALQAEVASEQARQLELALVSSRRIGAAVGVLMAIEHLTEEQAFARLVQRSQQLNRKLRDLAGYVTETGTLP